MSPTSVCGWSGSSSQWEDSTFSNVIGPPAGPEPGCDARAADCQLWIDHLDARFGGLGHDLFVEPLDRLTAVPWLGSDCSRSENQKVNATPVPIATSESVADRAVLPIVRSRPSVRYRTPCVSATRAPSGMASPAPASHPSPCPESEATRGAASSVMEYDASSQRSHRIILRLDAVAREDRPVRSRCSSPGGRTAASATIRHAHGTALPLGGSSGEAGWRVRTRGSRADARTAVPRRAIPGASRPFGIQKYPTGR
jgi:hypothetical protein